MASQDKAMALVAKVIGQYKGPLQDLQKALNQITDSQGKAHKAGIRAAIDHDKSVKQLHASFKETGTMIKTFFEPLMTELGIGALSVAGAFGAASKSALDFANSARGWGYLAEQTGLTVQTLREFEALAPRIGSSAEEMDKGFGDFNSKMIQFRNNRGELMDFFAKNPFLAHFATSLQHTTTQAQALQDVLKELSSPQIKTEPQKEMLLKALGLDPHLALLKAQELQQYLGDIRERIGIVSPDDLQRGKQFADSMSKLKDSLAGMGTEIGEKVAPGLTKMVDEFDAFAKNTAARESISGFFGGLSTILGTVAQAEGTVLTGLQAIYNFIDTQGDKLHNKLFGFLGGGSTSTSPRPNPRGVPLFHKSSYEGFGGNIIPASYTTGSYSDYGSSGETNIYRAVFAGTMQGVIEAFRQWENGLRGGGATVGLAQASYETGGDYSGGGRGGGSGGHRNGFRGDLLGPGGTLGGSHIGKVGKGMQARAQESYDFWRSQGLSRNAALGLVGNEQGEGTMGDGGTHLHWDRSHYSGGLEQWDPTRRAEIANATGIDVWHDSNHMHQLHAELWELQHKYPHLWSQLKRGDITIGQAAHAMVYGSERPADMPGQSRYRGGLGESWAGRLHDQNVMGNARNAGVGAHTHQVKGGATLDINFKGLPKHARTHTIVAGNIFKDVNLNRGKAGTRPSENGYA